MHTQVNETQKQAALDKAVDIRTRRAVMDTQGWIGDKLVVEAQITGLWV